MNRVDFVDRDIKIVGDTSEEDLLSGMIDDNITRAIIFIARLTDATHVDHDFFASERENVIACIGPDKFQVGREDARHMRVSLKAVLRDAAENAVHFVLIVDELGENIFVGWVAWGAVDVEEFIVDVQFGEFAQKVPTFVDDMGGPLIEAVAGPVDSAKGDGVKAIWVEQGGLVMVSHDGED